jgi:RNA polymerase sigma factor (sigma-70 family)
MDCEKLSQADMALAIIENSEDEVLQNRLFSCIYSLFYEKFIKRIQKRYRNYRYQDKLKSVAEDAFQNGLEAFTIKARQKRVAIGKSLDRTLYSFVFFQFLTLIKKDRLDLRGFELMDEFESKLEDYLEEISRQNNLDQREKCLMKILVMLNDKQRIVLTMKFFDKFTSKEISQMLNITVKEVHNVTWKGIKELKRLAKRDCKQLF